MYGPVFGLNSYTLSLLSKQTSWLSLKRFQTQTNTVLVAGLPHIFVFGTLNELFLFFFFFLGQNSQHFNPPPSATLARVAIRCRRGRCELRPVRGGGQSARSRIPKSSPTSGRDELLRRLLREGNAATPCIPSSFEWCTDGALHQPRWPQKELIPRLHVGVHKLMHVCATNL